MIRSGEGCTEKGAREGVNVQRGADNDKRGYRLILIMESVQVKRSIFPLAHVHPFSTPSPPPFLFPVMFRTTSSFYPCSLDLRGLAILISRHLFTLFYLAWPIIIPLPAGRSLISISSRRVENIARVSSYAGRTRDCQALSFVLHFAGSEVRGR